MNTPAEIAQNYVGIGKKKTELPPVKMLVLGILAGMASNTGQYMISDAAPEAPDFANGLFLTSANLGTTVGTALCGLFIAGFGTRSSLLGALLFSAAGIGSVIARNRTGKLKAATP